MKHWVMVALAALVAAGCSFSTRPPLPPPDGAGDCATAHATLERLGGCGVDLTRYEQDCRDAEAAEAQLGIRYPVACITAAASCEEARRCR